MIWLVYSVLFSSGLFLIFKWLGHLKIGILPAIVVNYFTCFLVGNLIPGHQHVFHKSYIGEEWFLPTLGMGFLFIAGFFSMGTATRKAGAAPASVASKMSVIVPAIVAIILFSEQLNLWQILGIVLSLVAVFLMVEPAESGKRIHHGLWLLVLVFLSSGAVDTGLNLLTHYYGGETDKYTTSTIIFGTAGVLGMFTLFVLRLFGGKKDAAMKFGIATIFGGILLGLVNYASLIAMFSAIEFYKGKTAWFFAVNNIAVVAVSSILAAILFREKHHRGAYFGLLLAVLALIFMNIDVVF